MPLPSGLACLVVPGISSLQRIGSTFAACASASAVGFRLMLGTRPFGAAAAPNVSQLNYTIHFYKRFPERYSLEHLRNGPGISACHAFTTCAGYGANSKKTGRHGKISFIEGVPDGSGG